MNCSVVANMLNVISIPKVDRQTSSSFPCSGLFRTHRCCILQAKVFTKLAALAASSTLANVECQMVVPLIEQVVCRHLDIGREGHKLIDAKVQQEGIDVVSEPFQYGMTQLL